MIPNFFFNFSPKHAALLVKFPAQNDVELAKFIKPGVSLRQRSSLIMVKVNSMAIVECPDPSMFVDPQPVTVPCLS